MSRLLLPSPASRSICRNCLMVSLLFAGITHPLVERSVMPKLLTQGGVFPPLSLAGC